MKINCITDDISILRMYETKMGVIKIMSSVKYDHPTFLCVRAKILGDLVIDLKLEVMVIPPKLFGTGNKQISNSISLGEIELHVFNDGQTRRELNEKLHGVVNKKDVRRLYYIALNYTEKLNHAFKNN